jgi:hypothetical protein
MRGKARERCGTGSSDKHRRQNRKTVACRLIRIRALRFCHPLIKFVHNSVKAAMNDGKRMLTVKMSAAVLVENSTFKRRRSTNNVFSNWPRTTRQLRNPLDIPSPPPNKSQQIAPLLFRLLEKQMFRSKKLYRTARSWRRERPQLSDFNSKLRDYLVRRHNANSDRSWAMALKRCTPAARGRRGRDGQSQTPHWGWRPVRQQRPRWRHSQLSQASKQGLETTRKHLWTLNPSSLILTSKLFTIARHPLRDGMPVHSWRDKVNRERQLKKLTKGFTFTFTFWTSWPPTLWHETTIR